MKPHPSQAKKKRRPAPPPADISDVAHDIQSALTVIRATAELYLLEKERLEPELDRLLRLQIKEVDKIVRILHDFMEEAESS